MSNKNLLSGRDKELQELAEQYELAMSAKQPFYLDADDLADLADWYGTKKNYDKALEIAEDSENLETFLHHNTSQISGYEELL